MFKFLFRKTYLKDCCKDDIKKAMELKDQYKTDVIIKIVLIFIVVSPLVSLSVLYLFMVPFSLKNEIILDIYGLIYMTIVILIWKRFNVQINIFEESIYAELYTSIYTFKGNAISKQDMDIIKEENEKLHWLISTMQNCKGRCYAISFELLKALKKGTIKFLPIEKLECQEEKEKYTMHVVYENNGWCFDTYSHKQYPLDEFVELWKAKEYKTFSYEDIKDKTYEEFREKEFPEFERYCKENDCYQKWQKD